MPKKVFILGAGFTKAFFPNAPLLIDHYDTSELEKSIGSLPHALQVLHLERDRNKNGKINIERLLTRLENGMPYDHSMGATQEFAVLLSRLKETFVRAIKSAKEGPNSVSLLGKLAAYCLMNQIDCLTFNYDDTFDERLNNLGGGQGYPLPVDQNKGIYRYWYPENGYGFPLESLIKKFMSTGFSAIPQGHADLNPSSINYLKLHGSMNWRIRVGAKHPFEMRSIVHFADWKNPIERISKNTELELEPAPFIIPPVLVKSDLVGQPVLKIVWAKAHRILSEAQEITFIGYSFPPTDLSSIHLFSEAINHSEGAQVRVVNLADDKYDEEDLIRAYARIFPGITRRSFFFKGALTWTEELLEGRDSQIWESVL